ncbi:MAG: PAS domain S-box protein, partial [Pseudomonadota bacterium]
QRDDVIGRHIGMLLPAFEPHICADALKRHLMVEDQACTSVAREVTARRKDGSVVPMEFRVNAATIEGAPMLIGTIRDISERKDAEAKLREEAEHLQAVMNTVIDGLITIDSVGRIQTFNSSAVRIFGYQPEEVIGQNVRILMPDPYHSEHDSYMRNYMETGDKKVIGVGREVSARRKDGSIFPMELGVNEMTISGERMFVGTIRDITERKEAENAIASYVRKLKLSNAELDEFAYIASHDIKEPLRGLSSNATFLQEDYEEKLDAGGVKRLNRMRYLCERMERLVDDLLYYSRIGRQDLAVQPTDLNEVIRDIEDMSEATLRDANAVIVTPEPLPTITCDLPRITELFRNLISNGVKYNDKPTKVIEVGVTTTETLEEDAAPERVFYVKDNGVGIAPEFHDSVFRIFKRLNEEDDEVKGTGVGLTFVKKIVERHNGRIWLSSEQGRGSTFYFTLNAHAGAEND